MGNANPRAFTRGKRGIAGSCIFTVFDRHPLKSLMDQAVYVAKDDDLQDTAEGYATNEIHSAMPQTVGDTLTLAAQIRNPKYADQIPPFDVTLAARNEYGQMASMRIFGIEFLNEGSGTSVDDTTNEVQMTFVARHVSHWQHYEGDFDTAKTGAAIGFTISSEGTTGPVTVTTVPNNLV